MITEIQSSFGPTQMYTCTLGTVVMLSCSRCAGVMAEPEPSRASTLSTLRGDRSL